MALRLPRTCWSKIVKQNTQVFLLPISINSSEIIRERHTKHWDPKFKWLRREKVIKVDLPKFNENTDDLTEDEMRSKLKERGLLPPRPYMEKQFFISCTGSVFEPYIPPEGDGKVSAITMQGAKQKLQYLEKKSKTMMAIRKIRQFEEDFDSPKFLAEATDIYKKMHECLTEQDTEKIQRYITERAYPEVVHNIECKTIRWKFLENIELPYIVHARCTDVITKENIFAQLTVRFHSKQILAVYDRFGRLIHGSEILAKDVLEYVVFEKHLANEYGVWRIHQKIIPDWMPPREPLGLTYIKPKTQKKLPVDSSVSSEKEMVNPVEGGGEKLITA